MIKFIKPEETYSIRLEVLRNNIDLPFEFDGDFDESTFHLGAFDDSKLVGIASFMKRKLSLFLEENQYQLRGMATLPKVRGKSFGNKILQAAILELKKRNVAVLWCNAREVALGFYQKNGFKIKGESFEINQIGKHYKLFKELK